MPFKSKEQIAKFGELVKHGKMAQHTFDAWMAETPNPHDLPDRITEKQAKAPRVKFVKNVKVIK
jgi:hypothetical protein